MSPPWLILYFRNEKGDEPVKEFFELPSKIGITSGEKKMFEQRLKWVQQKGLHLLRERSDVLEKLKSEDNLYSLRIPRTTNNPRVLLCALVGRPNCLVLLHAFKEKKKKDYDKGIALARKRRDLVCGATKN